jgi:glycosyltransferase involved in cell wall biosynthesis
MARVDVIVPCNNYGDLLDACVAGALSQQEVDTRVLIMDDASTDSTPEVGKRIAAGDPRVEYRRHADLVRCGRA